MDSEESSVDASVRGGDMQDVAATLTLLTNLPKIVSSLCRFKLRRFSWKRLGCQEQASHFILGEQGHDRGGTLQ